MPITPLDPSQFHQSPFADALDALVKDTKARGGLLVRTDTDGRTVAAVAMKWGPRVSVGGEFDYNHQTGQKAGSAYLKVTF